MVAICKLITYFIERLTFGIVRQTNIIHTKYNTMKQFSD